MKIQVQILALFLLLTPFTLCTQLCSSFSSHNAYFDLNAGQESDRQQQLTLTIQSQPKPVTLHYNLCSNVSQVCSLKTTLPNSVIQVTDYSGPAILVIGQQCIPFTTIVSSDLLDPQNLSSSYAINFKSQPVKLSFGDGTQTVYNLRLINPCQTSLTNQFSNNAFTIISSLPGCPVLDLTTIWIYFDNHKFAFFLTTLIFGVILMLLGLYMYRITIWLVGGMAGFGILLLVQSIVVFVPGVPNGLINSIVIITGITSIFIGYVTLYFPKLGTFGLGAWIGVILSFILNNIALYRIKSGIATLPLLITLGILAILFGVLALFFKKSFIIISTSFIGAYCSIRALSWYLGAFPNQFLISKQRQYYGAGVQWQYYVYVVALFILTGSSMAVQFWLFRKRAKLLGKSTDIDEYVNHINEKIDLQRSKYLVFENVFKKRKRNSKVEPKYLQKKKRVNDSDSNYSSSQHQESEEEDHQEEEEQEEPSEQQMQVMPKKLVKFEKVNYNKEPVRGGRRKEVSKESSQQSQQNSESEKNQDSDEEEESRYKNGRRKEPEAKRSLKQKLIPNPNPKNKRY